MLYLFTRYNVDTDKYTLSGQFLEDAWGRLIQYNNIFIFFT